MKLTKTAVDRLKPTDKEQIIFDDDQRGFGLRVTPSGAKSYLIQYRNREGRTRKLTLGAHGVLTAEQGRKMAREALGRVAAGADPSAERKETRAAPTMADLAAYYFETYAKQQALSNHSIIKNTRFWEDHIRAKLGPRKVAAITQADIRSLHLAREDTPVDANRLLRFLSRLFTLAEQRSWRTGNPCKGVKLYHEEKRERWLDEAEMARLLAELNRYALEHEDNCAPANAVRLILLTGCRPQEAISAKWEMFDIAAGLWEMPSHHTKQRRTHRVHLSDTARNLLATMDATAGAHAIYLFPGKHGDKPRHNVRRCWVAVTTRAGLADVHLHDLRHTFASHLVSRGASLYLVGKLLGHTQAATTQRYAHVAPNAQADAANAFAEVFDAAQRGAKAEVVTITKAGRAA